MEGYINFNGKLLAEGECSITRHNRSFKYGDGVFETLRCRQGYPMWVQYHTQRLQKSADKLMMGYPSDLTAEKITHLVTELLHANNHIQGARVRISFFRADGGFYKPIADEANFLIESLPLESEWYQLNKNGLKIGVYPDLYKSNSIISDLKTSSALLYVMAAIYARKNQWDDIIILNETGHVCEAGSSNIFMVENETLFTPALDQACVDGVMRKVIFDIAGKNGHKVVECAILPDDLLKADEVFVCNTIGGIKWLKGLKNKRYYHDLSTKLNSLLETEAKQYIIDNYIP